MHNANENLSLNAKHLNGTKTGCIFFMPNIIYLNLTYFTLYFRVIFHIFHLKIKNI